MNIRNTILNFVRPFRQVFDNLTYTSKERDKFIHFCSRKLPSTVLIVANGPSLNKTPLDEFSSYDVFSIGLNKIHLFYKDTMWRPNFVVSVNGLISKQSGVDMCKSNYQLLAPWKNRIFFPKAFRNKIVYFMSNYEKSFITEGFEIGGTSTVTASALQIVYKLGVDNVVIVGMDHNYDEPSSANEIVKMKGQDNSHFSKEYFKDGTFWGAPDINGSEVDYKLARLAFESRGGRIFDATVGGKCDVFEKINIDQALELFSLKNG